jgi:hypothetical protein
LTKKGNMKITTPFVVMFSGGICSWAAAKRIANEYGPESMTLLFADTKGEHPDTYRFLREAALNIGAPLVEVADGRTIWEVFKDKRILGNSLRTPCSRVLKQRVLDRWVGANCDPMVTTLVFGIHWSESERFDRLHEKKAPFKVRAPMCEDPWMPAAEMHRWAEQEGLEKQWLYKIGMPHANCGGLCVKAGIGSFVRAYNLNRTTFDEWERNEADVMAHLGRPHTILLETVNGKKQPLSLRALRERIESQCVLFDDTPDGGCGCAVE